MANGNWVMGDIGVGWICRGSFSVEGELGAKLVTQEAHRSQPQALESSCLQLGAVQGLAIRNRTLVQLACEQGALLGEQRWSRATDTWDGVGGRELARLEVRISRRPPAPAPLARAEHLALDAEWLRRPARSCHPSTAEVQLRLD